MSIPNEVQQYIDRLPDDIKEIDLNLKNLKELPDLSRFYNLKVLYCEHNQLTSIPVLNIPVLKNLQYLYCSDYQLCLFKEIMSIPTDVQQYIDSLPNDIEKIDLNGKYLKELPDLSRFYKLKVLICYNNQLTSIPVLNKLQKLDCHNNQLTSIPVLDNLQKLWCYNNQLTSIPVLNNLHHLDCSNNQLTSIPVLNNLQELYCHTNKLISISILDNLQKLYCSFNQLTSIPVLNNLHHLDCSYNQLTSIPLLKNLQVLSCDYNQLTSIPVLNNLKKIYSYNNPIHYIVGNDIKKLKKLNRLCELFYMIKCKKRLRNFYYENVLRPRMERKYHPENLIVLIEGNDEYEDIIDTW
jgi:Leucine-rich repeat (LRR) protein